MFEKEFERLLTEYKDAVDDKQRFTGLVKDFFPDKQMQSNLILAAYNMGIVKDIQGASDIGSAFAFRYVKRLVDEIGISRVNADWAISVWCVCYGQKMLGKPCDIKLKQGKNDGKPAIKDAKSGAVQYGDLFQYEKSTYANGYAVRGFSGNNRMIIFQNTYNGSPVVEIKRGAFSESNVEEVIFTEGIRRISERAFCGCTSLKQAIFSTSIKELADHAFEACGNLTTAALPPFLEQVGAYAMSGAGIKTVVFPKTVFWLGEGAFSYCKNIKEVEMPALCDEVASSLFRGCENLKKVKIHGKINAIGDYAFADCVNLETIFIPDSVKDIGEHAFENVHDKFILMCEMGSFAENYAKRNRLRYQLI